MKIRYLSDLHIGHFNYDNMILSYISSNMNKHENSSDVLIVAGDLFVISNILNRDNRPLLLSLFFAWCSSNFKKTIIIPGNHEFYDGTDIDEFLRGFNKEIYPNIHVVCNDTIIIDDVAIVCSTLWSNVYDISDQRIVNTMMNDCRLIKWKGQNFLSDRFGEAHDICKSFISSALSLSAARGIPSCKTIVATHHCPSILCEQPKYAGGRLSHAFIADDMNDIISTYSPAYWIYGHTHYNIDIDLFDTKIVSNQLGYNSTEAVGFEFDKYFFI